MGGIAVAMNNRSVLICPRTSSEGQSIEETHPRACNLILLIIKGPNANFHIPRTFLSGRKALHSYQYSFRGYPEITLV